MQRPVHAAPLVRRNTWDSNHQLCGHRAPVVVARFSPHLYHPRKVSSHQKAAAAGLRWRHVTMVKLHLPVLLDA